MPVPERDTYLSPDGGSNKFITENRANSLTFSKAKLPICILSP